jgi:transposase-like protein
VKLPPPNAAATIRKLAATGAGVKAIARALGTGDQTLSAWLREYPELELAMTEGREKERLALHDSLHRRAMDPKHPQGAISAMFLLKARHHYRENAIEDAGSRLNIVFNLPAAMPVEKYVTAIKKIRHGETERDADD